MKVRRIAVDNNFRLIMLIEVIHKQRAVHNK